MPHLMTLNVRQRLAAQFLASGMNRDQTAKHVGCDPATLSKWRRLPAFNDYLNSLIELNERESLQALVALRLRAVERLSVLLDTESPHVAIRVIEAILKQPQ